MFPLACRVAMDILPVQASAMSCERMFSSAARTDTKDRNRMSPELLQALQVLKFTYRQQRNEASFVDELVSTEADLFAIEDNQCS
jgi:hypothetical protein